MYRQKTFYMFYNVYLQIHVKMVTCANGCQRVNVNRATTRKKTVRIDVTAAGEISVMLFSISQIDIDYITKLYTVIQIYGKFNSTRFIVTLDFILL